MRRKAAQSFGDRERDAESGRAGFGADGLPRIAEFYGIAIYMYYRDPGAPHFHAVYRGDEAAITIRGLRVIEGRLPQRALALVRAWGRLRVEQLERDWELARGHRPLRRIAPLE